MRDDDPFITVRMAVDIFQENFFIGWPGAAADYGGAAVTELLYFGDLFCIFRDLFYPLPERTEQTKHPGISHLSHFPSQPAFF